LRTSDPDLASREGRFEVVVAEAVEHRQDQLKAELAAAPKPEPTRLHPNLAEIYRSKVAALHEALADEASRDEAFELIRSLIDKVVVTPAEGDMHIDLHGELAGILGLCREGRRGGQADAATVAQIKVVAGAHNHRQFALPPIPV
jgi:site-specific DNA recombinase